MLTVTDSKNAKIGNVSATYRGKESCPSDCPAFKACYAKQGHANIAFIRAGIAKTVSDAVQFTEWLAKLPFARKVRAHVSGDFVKDNSELDMEYTNAFIQASKKRNDLKIWGYTHAWKKMKANIFKGIHSVNINASCDSIEDIKEAKAMGFDTVTIMPEIAKTGIYNGERIVICPNQTNTKVTCETCMLCHRKERNYTIGFRVHGVSKAKYNFS